MTQTNSHFNEIVTTAQQRVEVCAGPGCLKTTALLARINHLLALGTPPESILVLTFSKAAVGVIRSRMLEVPTGDPCSDKLEHVRVMTCHKFSIGVIKSVKPRNECGLLSEEEAQTLLIEAIALVTKRCEQQQIWTGASQSVRNQRLANLKVLTDHLPRVSQFIEYARASLSTMQDVLDSGRFNQLAPFTKVLPAIRDCYINLMKKNGNIDYTGTLLRAARLLSKAARPLPYSHVLVDEYQDCSAAQVQVLAALAQEPERSIMVFGDGDQAIYGFSGAAHTPLKSVLSDVVEMPLPVSQRLTAETAALASAIAHHRPTLAIQTERTGEKPRLVMSRSMRVQLPKIVNAISSLIESGVQPNQIAVLARKKAQLRPVEQALLANSIDTERKGATRNKDQAITVLKLVNGIEKLATLSQADAVDLMAHFVEHINLLSNRDLIREAAVSFRYAFRSRSLEGRYIGCAKAYLTLCGGARKNKELRDDINRWAPLCRGRQSAREMRDFIIGVRDIGITTSTIHATKGGTWEHVFIVGATEGLLPAYQSANSPSALNEERNLLYVAVTRARQSVHLFHTPTRHARSRQRFNDVSQLLTGPQAKGLLDIERN